MWKGRLGGLSTHCETGGGHRELRSVLKQIMGWRGGSYYRRRVGGVAESSPQSHRFKYEQLWVREGLGCLRSPSASLGERECIREVRTWFSSRKEFRLAQSYSLHSTEPLVCSGHCSKLLTQANEIILTLVSGDQEVGTGTYSKSESQ